MPSTISWLDFSEADQRRAREIVQLFSQQDSRDELGIGTVRDALSDAMFPGISVVQSRARYFLFVPWRPGSTKPRFCHNVSVIGHPALGSLRPVPQSTASSIPMPRE